MNLFKLVNRLFVLWPILGTAQNVSSWQPAHQHISLRPVFGAGGEAAVGAGVLGEYGYQLTQHGPTFELVLQLGAFRSIGVPNMAYQRDYRFKNLLTGIGFKVGTVGNRKFYGKIGIGIAYHRGSEVYDYLQESIRGPEGTQELWRHADRRYREIVFNGTVEVGVRLTPQWDISLGSMLITGVGEGNGLLLIGPGVSRRF